MDNLYISKNKRIHEIISIVKLSSLLLSGIAFFNYIFKINDIAKDNTYNWYSMLTIGGVIFILSILYFIWVSLSSKKLDLRYRKIIQVCENLVFIMIFTGLIIVSGNDTSDYKFLFLFIIIAATIQQGMKYGMITACISSLVILVLDIISAPNLIVNQYFQNDLILAGVFILTAWPLGFYVKIEGEHIKKLESLAHEDGLTEVYNHRYFRDTLREKIALCKKENKPISMMFIDIDYFKHYNELYGHLKGDEVLKKIGRILKDSTRQDDVVARYGGEEFAIILENTTEIDAVNLAEIIRNKIENTHFEGEENQPHGKLTVSIGISTCPDKASGEIELIKSADDALYRAKFFNKNRVETYTSILDELKNDIEEKHIDLITSVKTLISVINAKDRYTYGHVERVVIYSRLLADKLGLNEKDKKNLIYGAYMHDIGKINISKEILNKHMPLTSEEWETMKQHTVNGVDIIKPVTSLEEITPLILHHHERYDGSGYPSKLAGEDIPYMVRMLTVVDSFDAMTSSRPYNKRRTYKEAVEELKRCSGTQFDPHICDAFIEIIEEKKEMFSD